MNKIAGIYVLISTLNGYSYVGSSVDIYGRFKEHIRMLETGKHHSHKLQKHWDKGLAVKGGHLELHILEECKLEDMPRLELEYIRVYDSVKRGFNCTYDTRRAKVKPKRKPRDRSRVDFWFATKEFRE